jgi:hypothetical protein
MQVYGNHISKMIGKAVKMGANFVVIDFRINATFVTATIPLFYIHNSDKNFHENETNEFLIETWFLKKQRIISVS